MDRLLYFISILIIWIVSNYCLKLGETIKVINVESPRVRRSNEQQLRRDGYVYKLMFINKPESFRNKKLVNPEVTLQRCS